MKTQAIHMKLISDQQRKRLQKDRGTPPASIFEDIELLTTQNIVIAPAIVWGHLISLT